MCRRARLQGVGSSFILDRRKETAALKAAAAINKRE